MGLILDAGWTAKATAEHLGMNARSVATWANAERAARRDREWTEQVKPHFGFLEAYGFAVAMASAADWREVTVTYQSSISAVTIVQSVECDQVIVLLTRPTDGNLPKDAWVRMRTQAGPAARVQVGLCSLAAGARHLASRL